MLDDGFSSRNPDVRPRAGFINGKKLLRRRQPKWAKRDHYSLKAVVTQAALYERVGEHDKTVAIRMTIEARPAKVKSSPLYPK